MKYLTKTATSVFPREVKYDVSFSQQRPWYKKIAAVVSSKYCKKSDAKSDPESQRHKTAIAEFLLKGGA